MVNFSTNQVMQFYVCDGTETVSTLPGGKAMIKFADTASDVIENVESAVYKTASSLATKTKQAILTISGLTDSQGDEAYRGKDFIVRVKYPSILGNGVEGWTTKTVCVRGNDSDSVLANLAEALSKALKEDAILETFYSEEDAELMVYVKDNTKYYKRGVRPIIAPDFVIEANEVDVDGELKTWLVVDYETPGASIPAVFKLADLEYFAMGERGDQYRGMGYPDVIDTEYKIDTTKTYDVINIHYAYKGANQNSHKSEKEIFIAGTTANVKRLGGLLEGALGVEIKNLPAA